MPLRACVSADAVQALKGQLSAHWQCALLGQTTAKNILTKLQTDATIVANNINNAKQETESIQHRLEVCCNEDVVAAAERTVVTRGLAAQRAAEQELRDQLATIHSRIVQVALQVETLNVSTSQAATLHREAVEQQALQQGAHTSALAAKQALASQLEQVHKGCWVSLTAKTDNG